MRSGLRDTVAVLTAVVAPLLLALLLIPFRTSVTTTNAALLLVVVVVAVAAFGNGLAGAVAALSSAAWFDFFHAAPFESFDIRSGADVETAVLLLAVGLVVSQLASRAKVLRHVAVTEASHLERLHRTTRLLASGASADDVALRVRDELRDVLEPAECRFEYGEAAGHLPYLEPDGSVKVPGWIWDVDRQGWPDGEIELRVTVSDRIPGRFVLTPEPGAAPPPLEARLVALDLAAQVAAAMPPPARVAVTPQAR
ncbi:DUF4118 domain-containing protein [Streptomyces sp. NBC_00102]|uniref:DUF4118 domain-containing protein n=1 Tax=Streptomyces sp. NBC_00102 TaxID=2975652 RepID=UPI00224F2BA2|nr:DUF4118 domain-containing protein [Streptomyces sp. NBC_00102]MCX5401737.1 DUF4118 domain-containing protein [Streptomyces sp. NBC_00102]